MQMLSFDESQTDAGQSGAAGVPVRLVQSLAVPLQRLASGLLLLFLVLPALSAADETLRQRLEQLREHSNPSVAGVRLASAPVLDDFYRERSYTFVWRDATQVEGLKLLAERSREHGLDPGDFHVQELDRALGGQDPVQLVDRDRADAEILLSDSLLRLIHHYRFGKVDPHDLDSSWNHDDGPYSDTLAQDLGRAIDAADLEREVLAMWRQPVFYTRLKDGLARYRGLAAAGGWSSIPAGRNLDPGTRSSRIPLVRGRLRATGEYAVDEPAEAGRYDADLEQAVRAFQERHTLAVDGIVGPATLAAMNVSAERRVEQIRVNLERMRWVGDDLSGNYVLVDIAAQEVELHRDGKLVWESRVIVGRPKRQTPVFRDRIEYLEFNPTWTVPPTILKEDILPKARRNPNAVRKKGLEVINRKGRRVAPESVNWNVSHNNLKYMLRQPPGPKNALGRVKFMFPNRHSVYLHDTPGRSLFKKAKRAYSSGCVRVDRPFELAELLLDDPKWNQSRFKSLLRSKRPATVHLKQPIPVILSYWTAEADEGGAVHFREDIYGRDAAVLAALDGAGAMRMVYRARPSPESPSPESPPSEPTPAQEPERMAERMAGIRSRPEPGVSDEFAGERSAEGQRLSF